MPRGLTHAEHIYQPWEGCPPGLTAAERCVLRYGRADFVMPRMPLQQDRGNVLEGVVAKAFVERGRWSVKCPWCSSQQYADLNDRRFLCVDCCNAAGHGKWVRVHFEIEPEHVERTLMRRPDPKSRNWRPGITIEFMEEENLAHLGGQ